MNQKLKKIKDKVSLVDSYGDEAKQDVQYLLTLLEEKTQEAESLREDAEYFEHVNVALTVLVERAREVLIDEILARNVKRVEGFKTKNMRLFAGFLKAYDRWKNQPE